MKRFKLKILGILTVCAIITYIFLPGIAAAATGNQLDPSITRIYGNDRFETAAKIAEAGWPGTSNYAILADGMDANLIDALTAGPLAAKLNAPILLTQGDSLNSYAQQELTRLDVKTVYITITSSPAVNLQNIIQQVKAIPTVTDVESLGGSDPSQTSVNIANELATQGVNINKVIIVGGSGVDALSISPIAGAQGMPILYSNGDALASSVSGYLNGLKSSINTTYIIGGTGTISDAVASQLPGSVVRVAGQDRYDTNIQVLKKFAGILKYKNTFLANGDTLVDALAVAPLAAQSGSPILLTSQSLPFASAAYAQAYLSPNVVALGGESVVSSSVLSELSPQQVIDQNGTTQGSTDPANLTQINSVLKITGNNVTLGNATSNDSIYIQGDNATLNNVSTQGTIFIDPGISGTAALQNVTAANIVIMSGAPSSIELQNVTSNALLVAGSNNVHVKASGTTNISQTTATSSANLDNSGGGSFGPITIASAAQSDPTPSVQFTGTFTQSITVNDTAIVVAAPNASVANVVAIPDNASQTVTVQGTFTNVTVNSPCNLTLGSNTTVQTVVTNSKANITVPTSSSITNLNTNNLAVTVGGVPTILSASAVNGTVNGTINVTLSSIDPSWPSTGPTSAMFTVTQSINGGAAIPVSVSGIGGNNTDFYLIVPTVITTSIPQSVIYSVSYKGGTPVSTTAITVSSNLASPTLALTSPVNLPQATAGQLYSYTITATGGSGYSFTYKLMIPTGAASNYPDGLSLSTSGVLNGYPQAAGTWTGIPVAVTDSAGSSVTNYFNLTVVTLSSNSTLAFTSSVNLSQATVGQLYSYSFMATGGSGYGYTYRLTIPSGAASNYPDGLSLSTNGIFSGYPQTAGTWTGIPVTVTDSAGNSVTNYFNLTVAASTSTSTLAFTNPVNLPQAAVGQPYSYTFTATGGTGSGYTYSLTIPPGALSNYPDGLSLSSSGVLSGTPLAEGTWTGIPVTVTDSAGNSVTNYFNLTVPPTLVRVNAFNGTIYVTLSNNDPSWSSTGPTPDMFTVTQSINGGAATQVAVTGIGGSGTNLYLIVPTIQSGSMSQNVIDSVSYKDGQAVPSILFTVPAD